MPKIELIFDADCPNVEATRHQLRKALGQIAQPAEWLEWDRGDPKSPPYVRGYGSPTVLVNGRDVAGASASERADCCRLYHNESGGPQGVPSVQTIAAALARAETRAGLRSWLAAVPAVFVTLLPSVTCPACWPAYAGLLSALGLPFVNYTPVVTPLTVAALVIAVSALGHRAKTRRGYGPLIMGIVSAVLVLAGKFAMGSNLFVYLGIALLIGASVWNTWPRGKAGTCAGPRWTIS